MRGGKGGRGRRFRDRKGGKDGKPKDAAARTEQLDNDMDNWWAKNGQSERAKETLDDDLSNYFKKAAAAEGEAAANGEVAKAQEEKKE